MKIRDNINRVKLETVESGLAFRYDGELFIRVVDDDCAISAVCLRTGELYEISLDESVEVVQCAINALESYDEYERLKGLNTPKKPTNKDSSWYCPNCKWEMPWEDEYTQHTFDHCTECGQSIDWM